MDTTGAMITAFLVAAGLGAVIGLERQTSHDGEPDDYAGARTFALYAVLGVLAGFTADQYGPVTWLFWAFAALALVGGSYVFAFKATGDWGTTTEAASFVTFGVGALVWAEEIVVGVALAVGTVALLKAKGQLHSMSRRFSDADVRAAVQFGVITAIILPLLPDETYGPFGAFNPREIWLMVVLVSAVGLAGYLGIRFKGTGGLVFTGLVGGLISSTAVTLGFARMSRNQAGIRRSLTAGILGASGLMFFRVLILALVVAPAMAEVLAVPLIALGTVVVGVAVWEWVNASRGTAGSESFEVKNPLSLSVALQFGALYAAVVFIAKLLLDQFSESALNVVGAVSGINDVDAINLSMANLVNDGLNAEAGASAVLLAVAVNTLVKATLVAGVGDRKALRIVIWVLGLAAVGGVLAWFLI
ncbi:MAG: MgtC/SapB family protein [Acidimicrobiia bacterium]|nr:MgtC/SapB family protein [Acidimicrobiia bacterium]